MLDRFRRNTAGYPRQFWILFFGLLVNSSGSSMVWPFLTIYMRGKLGAPLTTITLLFTLNAVAGLVATSLAGPAVDRFGRKGAMVLGLASGCLVLLAMSAADTLPLWGILMAFNGLFGPVYRVGADAMIADLIAPERRIGAYALLRMITNLGIAIGPAIGGFITGVSYSLAFYIAAAAQLSFVLLIALAVRETMPRAQKSTGRRDGSYIPVLRDRPFIVFCAIYTVALMPASMLMMLLAVYAKENFGVPESQYGFIMATNAAMVVLFQYAVTQWSKRRGHLQILALGALFYAVGVGSVALGRGFAAFWLSMVIATIGELLMAPTGSAYAANAAPADKRGRYMGLFGITWGVGFGIGPVLGGWLNDQVAPAATWCGAFVIGLTGAMGFLFLLRRRAMRAVEAR
jgi:MFS family permease